MNSPPFHRKQDQAIQLNGLHSKTQDFHSTLRHLLTKASHLLKETL